AQLPHLDERLRVAVEADVAAAPRARKQDAVELRRLDPARRNLLPEAATFVPHEPVAEVLRAEMLKEQRGRAVEAVTGDQPQGLREERCPDDLVVPLRDERELLREGDHPPA